jgi:hypothetical protein
VRERLQMQLEGRERIRQRVLRRLYRVQEVEGTYRRLYDRLDDLLQFGERVLIVICSSLRFALRRWVEPCEREQLEEREDDGKVATVLVDADPLLQEIHPSNGRRQVGEQPGEVVALRREQNESLELIASREDVTSGRSKPPAVGKDQVASVEVVEGP